MYYCRVLTGDYTAGNSTMIDPPPKTANGTDLYDTVVDNTSNPTIFVVFRDYHAYPEYLITFTWTANHKGAAWFMDANRIQYLVYLQPQWTLSTFCRVANWNWNWDFLGMICHEHMSDQHKIIHKLTEWEKSTLFEGIFTQISKLWLQKKTKLVPGLCEVKGTVTQNPGKYGISQRSNHDAKSNSKHSAATTTFHCGEWCSQGEQHSFLFAK